MQEDTKLSRSNYTKVNFMVNLSRNKRNRIWDRPAQQDIFCDALSKMEPDYEPSREIT